MIFRIALALVAVIFLSGCASRRDPTAVDTGAVLPLNHLPAIAGDYFELDSRSVGRPFHIYVRLPENYDPSADTRYPVVYVLDGDSLYPILAANHLFLSYDENLPEAIIVGIAYGSFKPPINRRGFDFSAPAADRGPGQGGAPRFHDFLKTELLPAIDREYATNPARRVLFGQSRGGYMVLYSAFTEPDLFWGRIASNPVLLPGRERFFGQAEPALRDDLGLVVTSGSRDRPPYREAALEWFAHWESRNDGPWAVHAVTIDGGTHAANSTTSYRTGMLWLFGRNTTCLVKPENYWGQ